MFVLNCATGTLAPYVPDNEHSWNHKRVQHLYRRLGFGATPSEIEQALQQNPLTVVNQLLNEAVNAEPIPEPEWANWVASDYDDFFEQIDDQYLEWGKAFIQDTLNNSVRAKLVLFWSNHFVTKLEAYLCPSWLYRYHRVLETYAFGNFKTFVREIGITPAMLVFLNGVQNTKAEPNENYARELYELFTLGRDNGYTQDDITETARALTGYNGVSAYCGDINFFFFTHDAGQKTIFGQTGNWGYDDVIDILFDQRADEIADYICRKLYHNFVSADVEEDIIAELAQTLKDNDFELLPIYRHLFQSEHFFDDANISVLVKSPLDHHLQLLKEGNFSYNKDTLLYILYFANSMGQQIYSPTDVSGWAGNRSWISNSTLTMRWQSMRFFLYTVFGTTPAEFTALAKTLAGDSNDVHFVAKTLVDHFLPAGLQHPEDYERMTMVFKIEIPQNYFDQNLWNLDWETVPAQVGLLLLKITELPEFQLS